MQAFFLNIYDYMILRVNEKQCYCIRKLGVVLSNKQNLTIIKNNWHWDDK